MRFLVNSMLVFFLLSPIAAQDASKKRKPILIRSETVDAPKEEVIVEDPEVARKNLTIGDFYFKRDNYKAAEERYRDAVRYNPKWSTAYEKLARALEKQNQYQQAIEVCEQFIEKNPGAQEVREFRKLAARLKEKAASG